MRRISSVLSALWGRAADRAAVVAALDFLLLALAAYLGYALRLGLFIPAYYATDCRHVALLFPSLMVGAFALLGQYRTLWAQASLEDYARFTKLYVAVAIAFIVTSRIWSLIRLPLPRISLAIMIFAGILFCGALRVSWRLAHDVATARKTRTRALIVGAGEAGTLLARDLLRNASDLAPVAFVDDDPQKIGKCLAGLDVLGDTSRLTEIVPASEAEVVLIALPSARGGKIRALYDQLSPLGVDVRILPSLRELAGGRVSVTRLRRVELADLLGRDPVRIELDEPSNYIRGRRVLVTGAGGSIGSEIVRQVLQNGPAEMLLLGHGEQSIYLLVESLAGERVPLRPIIADVADETAMRDVFDRWSPQLVFHAAAHKHVPLMELSPREALRVNASGTRTLARAAGASGVERMVLISTDKAVNPSSVMGATKRVAEMILAQEQRRWPRTAYMAVRFGNVLGSRGSVVPKFEEQIAAGGPVTVTAPQMKRYFMLIPEAVSLVIQAGAMGEGGELFVLDMGEPVVIAEMAELLIRLCGYEPHRDIPIVFTGIRPGEKIEEELFYDPDTVRPTQHPKIFASALSRADAPQDASPDLDAMIDEAVAHPERALELLHRMVPRHVEGGKG
ncbi:MAG: polysaccharide biosynthesis protein [Synergistaceae bacterium]|nr:polysaccharide biosynthesis protein [Synergistaceae bacterium]